MKSTLVLCLLLVLSLTSYAGIAPGTRCTWVPNYAAAGDTIYVPGGTLDGAENAGSLETAINGDTTGGGGRTNVNRVYALYQGQVYFQLAPIVCNDPNGKLTICAVPSASGTQKPIILITPVPPATTISTNAGATVNLVYGSVKLDGIHYQAMQVTGSNTNELFQCGTSTGKAQSLEINNCLIEFSNIDLFDCTNETGAIGGWPYGAKFRITNSYFRNLFYAGQWWGSRVYQCKHPTDTVWVENCTVTTGGLTFLQQNQLTDFMYINHNTIINNKKYWLLSPYHKTFFVTNNIFVNQNWVGEDTNVTNSGQDPDKYYMSTINVDTNNRTNGELVQDRYHIADTTRFSTALDLNKLIVYVSDNINYYDPLLSSQYYNSSVYKDASINALPSYLTWFGYPGAPFKIGNVPGEWMNTRTSALFAAYGPGHGGMIEKRTSTANPGMTTPAIANAAEVDSMAHWNAAQWGDTRFAAANLTSTPYIYGDYDPTTLPGVISGHKVDTITTGKAGISKFTDLQENFAQSSNLSAIDNLPIGALMWDDAKNAAFNSATDYGLVVAKYIAEGGLPLAVQPQGTGLPGTYTLSQNYPNPFNPSTVIEFSLPKASNVDLKVFNMLGQEVATLAHGSFSAGDHTVTFSAKNLASGLYFYRLTADQFSSVRKMMLLK